MALSDLSVDDLFTRNCYSLEKLSQDDKGKIAILMDSIRTETDNLRRHVQFISEFNDNVFQENPLLTALKNEMNPNPEDNYWTTAHQESYLETPKQPSRWKALKYSLQVAAGSDCASVYAEHYGNVSNASQLLMMKQQGIDPPATLGFQTDEIVMPEHMHFAWHGSLHDRPERYSVSLLSAPNSIRDDVSRHANGWDLGIYTITRTDWVLVDGDLQYSPRDFSHCVTAITRVSAMNCFPFGPNLLQTSMFLAYAHVKPVQSAIKSHMCDHYIALRIVNGFLAQYVTTASTMTMWPIAPRSKCIGHKPPPERLEESKEESKEDNTGLIILIVVSVVGVLLLITTGIVIYKRKKSRSTDGPLFQRIPEAKPGSSASASHVVKRDAS